MKNYTALLSALYGECHCILPSKLREIEAFLIMKAEGGSIESPKKVKQPEMMCFSPTGEEVAAERVASAGSAGLYLAVLPLFGTMSQHGGMIQEASGGTSTEQFGAQFDALDRNQAVKTIVIESHTPGGQVFGVEELSNKIHASQTRVVTVGNSQVASAGVWASSAANEVYITPGGEMGSIGVVRAFEDVSAAEEKAGIKTTLIATPQRKVAEWGVSPLTDEIESEIRAKTEATYERFVTAVARNMGVSTEKVIADFGGGGMLSAKDAVSAGLANDMATKDEVLAQELSRLKSAGSGNSKRNARALAIAQAENESLEIA